MLKKRLDGKIALITGSAQGIGEEIATIFAREGAIVIVSDINDELGGCVATKIGASAIYLHLDVRQEKDWLNAIALILEKFSKLDILVNNAGVTGFQEGFGPQDPENASLESWREVHAVNSDGVFLGCKHAIQTMKNNPGSSIINISSRSGLVGIPGAAAYASSKAAIRNHTKSVALYCCTQGYKIRCNSIHPAAILTPMWEPMLGNGPDRSFRIAQIAKDIPMQTMGMPDDVANAALFLASDESKYITGIELTIDGGLLAGAGAPPTKND
ncbi:MAG: glucose 1-dehydrogenase [Chlamydiae bacterium]|jgi:NAD(P)-dependent dehydrogenase (short-subunit alcohol dehydrogenase family)|nr:glucose 1-dehydrogenase [Chlamydiota bacterium]